MKKSVIYKIVFQDGSIYVGQTQDYHRRKKEHLSTKGKGSPKLEQAFEQDPEPAFYVLEETTDLDNREVWWIDRLKPELNTLPGGEAMRGLNHPRAHYTREQVLEVVNLWTTTALKVTEIAEITGINHSTCHDIVKKRSHLWATQDINMTQYERKTSYRLWDPTNMCFESSTLREMADKTGLTFSQVNSVMVSKRGYSNTGWSTAPHPQLTLTDPQGNKVTMTQPLCKTLLEDMGLSKYQVRQLTIHHKPSAGWKVTVCT